MTVIETIYHSPVKPHHFDATYYTIGNARRNRNQGYPYVTAGLISNLLHRSDPQPASSARMRMTRPPELDMFERYRLQLQAAPISSSLKEQLDQMLRYPLDKGFLPENIKQAVNEAQHIPSLLEKESDAQYFPHIFYLWETLQGEFPLLQNITLRVSDPSVNPFEETWYQPDKAENTIQLPFNWKLSMQLFRNVHTQQLHHIAEYLEIDKRLITDDMLLVYHFLHSVEQILEVDYKREQTNTKEVSLFALHRMSHLIDTIFANSIAQQKEILTFNDFQQLLNQYFPETQDDILMAYGIAIRAHKNQIRASKEPYFSSHLLQVAILLINSGIRDSQLIAAALLHDVMEDTDYFAKGIPIDYEDPTQAMYERMATIFSPELALTVQEITEREHIFQSINHPNLNRSKEENEDEYHDRFVSYSVGYKTIILKIADRLQNIQTLKYMPVEKQIAKIQETKQIYLAVFHRPFTELPNEPLPESYEEARKKLLRKLEQEIRKREEELGLSLDSNRKRRYRRE